jgi:hypothetical protein
MLHVVLPLKLHAMCECSLALAVQRRWSLASTTHARESQDSGQAASGATVLPPPPPSSPHCAPYHWHS